MKLLKQILILILNWLAACIIIFGVTIGIEIILNLIYPNITDAELLTRRNLGRAYMIGNVAGVIIWIILQPISKKIKDYVWNWKKKRTVGSFVDDGRDVEESLSNARRGKELD